MAKLLIILVSVLFSLPAMAKFECHLLLTNSGQRPFSETDRLYAELWTSIHQGQFNGDNPRWSEASIQQKWSSWRAFTPLQREQALALEILKLSPVQSVRSPLISTSIDLKNLSAGNKARMLQHLKTAFPEITPAAPYQKRLVRALARQIQFTYGRTVNPLQSTAAPEGYNAPIASPRELATLGLAAGLDDYYSDLTGTSPSAEFAMLAVPQEMNPIQQLGNVLRRETAVLKPEFARGNGFAIPAFTGASQLLEFFEFWNEPAAEELFRASWIGLPNTVRGYPEFRAYAEMYGDELFQRENAYRQMGPLRTKLVQFVLTAKDAEDFLRDAFVTFYLHAGEREKSEARQAIESRKPYHVMQIFRNYVFPFLHMPGGMSLRVPGVVSAPDYQLSRVDETQRFGLGRSTHPLLKSYEPFYDPRRVDHDTKP